MSTAQPRGLQAKHMQRIVIVHPQVVSSYQIREAFLMKIILVIMSPRTINFGVPPVQAQRPTGGLVVTYEHHPGLLRHYTLNHDCLTF